MAEGSAHSTAVSRPLGVRAIRIYYELKYALDHENPEYTYADTYSHAYEYGADEQYLPDPYEKPARIKR